MIKLNVEVPSKTYPVYIGDEAVLAQLAEYIACASHVVVISDENVAKLHFETLRTYLPKKQLLLSVPAGEANKDMNHYSQLTQALIMRKIDRQAVIIAFGGGMVGDLAGFVAATYLRGVRFIQIPTTVLAHDSSVGGKVAINHSGVKNSIGAFYQPEAVFYNTEFLTTLPNEQWLSGLAEMVKHGYLSAPVLDELLLATTLPMIETNIAQLLAHAIAVKIEFVQADERESGVRRYLNLGHTFAHALESITNYQLPHGIAVMYGLCFVHELVPFAQSPYQFLSRFGYPSVRLEQHDFARLYNIMQSDKKASHGSVRFVVPNGQGYELVSYDEEQLRIAYHQFLKHSQGSDK